MRDDPFTRPDVRALLECVAAGDDDSEAAAAVLADVLDEAGEPDVARCCRHLNVASLERIGYKGNRLLTLKVGSVRGVVLVRLWDRIGRRRRPRAIPGTNWPRDWPAGFVGLAVALAQAADRLAARAAAE